MHKKAIYWNTKSRRNEIVGEKSRLSTIKKVAFIFHLKQYKQTNYLVCNGTGGALPYLTAPNF